MRPERRVSLPHRRLVGSYDADFVVKFVYSFKPGSFFNVLMTTMTTENESFQICGTSVSSFNT